MISEKDLAFDYFIKRTDRKSLYTQLQDLVKTAQNVAEKELDERRNRLRQMLEKEDEIYEEEFAKKVKSRIGEDIKKRKDVLLKIKEARNEQEHLLLEKKLVQKHFESCYEIREALRRKDTVAIKEAQLEQITEKERALVRQKQLDNYWHRMGEVKARHYDQQLEKEMRLKKSLERNMRCQLNEQVAYHNKQMDEKREAKRKEAEELTKVLEEIRLEEFDRTRLGEPEKMLAYRKELLDVIAENKEHRDTDYCKCVEEHRELMRQVAKEEREHSEALAQRKRAAYNATMEYLNYARRMRKMEEDAQKVRDARIDDLLHVDICTKSNLQQELKRKAEIAELCYAELRRQICEEYERRLRDVQEQREPKIIENRFARPERTRADIMAQRRKMRQDLDEQLIENARIQAENEVKYNEELKKAVSDPNFCLQLAEKYEKGGVDYLPPHPNWFIYACPQKEYVGKQAASEAGAGDQGDVRSKPCVCDPRTRFDCTQNNRLRDKRGPDGDKKLLVRETC